MDDKKEDRNMIPKTSRYINTVAAPVMTAIAILYGSFVIGQRVDKELDEFSNSILPVVVEGKCSGFSCIGPSQG